MAESSESMEVMLFREATAYRTTDYLRSKEQACGGPKDPLLAHASVALSSDMTSLGGPSAGGRMNEKWREKMCEWCYRVVDHYELSRSVVAVAMNYLDRFLEGTADVIDKKTFQLVTMAALFIAIKLSERRQLSMASMIALSRGCFKVEQLAAMELTLLSHLSWLMYPPTAHTFAHEFLRLHPAFCTLPTRVLYQVSQVSSFWMELSTMDYYFAAHHAPSHVALAALLNAVEELAQNHLETCCLRLHSSAFVDEEAVVDCRHRLRLLWDGLATGDVQLTEPEDRASPVCVSFGTSSFYQDH